MSNRDQQIDFLSLQKVETLGPTAFDKFYFPLLITNDFPEQVRIQSLCNTICVNKIEGFKRKNSNSDCAGGAFFIGFSQPGNTKQQKKAEDSKSPADWYNHDSGAGSLKIHGIRAAYFCILSSWRKYVNRFCAAWLWKIAWIYSIRRDSWANLSWFHVKESKACLGQSFHFIQQFKSSLIGRGTGGADFAARQAITNGYRDFFMSWGRETETGYDKFKSVAAVVNQNRTTL